MVRPRPCLECESFLFLCTSRLLPSLESGYFYCCKSSCSLSKTGLEQADDSVPKLPGHCPVFVESAYIPTWGVCWEHLRDLLFSREFCLMVPSWVWNQPQFSDLVLYWVSCHLFKYLTDSALASRQEIAKAGGGEGIEGTRGFPSSYRYPKIVTAALALFQEMLLMGTLLSTMRLPKLIKGHFFFFILDHFSDI